MELDLENAVFTGGLTYLDMIGKAEVSLEGPAGNALVQILVLFIRFFLTGNGQEILLGSDGKFIFRKPRKPPTGSNMSIRLSG